MCCVVFCLPYRERYRDLISAADTIVEIRNAASKVRSVHATCGAHIVYVLCTIYTYVCVCVVVCRCVQ